MAFNVGNFVKDTAKSAVTRTVDNIVGNAVAGLPLSTSLIASSSAQTLFNIGSSYESVSALTSVRTDNIISGASDAFFALAGRSVDRAGGVPISQLRRAGSSESLSLFLQEINPSTKINNRKRDQYEILSVL